MKKIVKFTLALGLLLSLGACSSSQTSETVENGVDPTAPAADAGTDAVPQGTTENAANPANPDAPPLDPAAAPADPALAQQNPDPSADPAAAPVDTTAPANNEQIAAQPTEGEASSPAGSGQYESYTVQQGDTLMKVAFETYGDLYRWHGLLEANKDKISDPNHIPAGTVIKVEKPSTPVAVAKNGEKYLIKNGDTLGTISNDVYSTPKKWKVLWENNKQMIHDPNRIFAGFYLYYQPDASSPPASESPTVTPAPMAKALSVPKARDGAQTATNAGDPSARMPASAAPAGGTATQ